MCRHLRRKGYLRRTRRHPQWAHRGLLTSPKAKPATALPCLATQGPLTPKFSEEALTALFLNCQAWTQDTKERWRFSLLFVGCSTGVRGQTKGNNWLISKLKSQSCDGINICSQANLPITVQNFTFSGQQDSFTWSIEKFRCSVSPACEGRRTQSALAYFVSKQLSDSISTNKKGYNYTLIL
jgi:hypothetical protein